MKIKSSPTPKDNGKTLPKAPATIHYDSRALKLIHRKLFNVLLYYSFEDQKQDTHQISLWALCELLGHGIERIKKAAQDLQTTLIEWDVFHSDGNHEWGSSQMLGSCKVIRGPNTQVLEFSFPYHLRDKIKSPEIWAMIKIDIQNILTSKYAHALYEQCSRFANVGSTGFIDLEEWYKVLGIPETSIRRGWAFVNSQYIKPSITKINESTDMHIKVETKKSSYQTVAARFIIEIDQDFTLPRPGQQFKLIEKNHIEEQIKKFAGENPAAKWLEDRRAGKVSPPSSQMPLLP